MKGGSVPTLSFSVTQEKGAKFVAAIEVANDLPRNGGESDMDWARRYVIHWAKTFTHTKLTKAAAITAMSSIDEEDIFEPAAG